LHPLSGVVGALHRRGGEEEIGDEAFPGAVNRQVRLADPERGLWRVQLSAQGEDAYFFTALFPGDSAKRITSAEAREAVRGGATASFAKLGAMETRVHSVRTPAMLAPLRGTKAQPMPEPSIVNHTLVFSWPEGKERAVIFSEAE
jgi:hypothetical protein